MALSLPRSALLFVVLGGGLFAALHLNGAVLQHGDDGADGREDGRQQRSDDARPEQHPQLHDRARRGEGDSMSDFFTTLRADLTDRRLLAVDTDPLEGNSPTAPATPRWQTWLLEADTTLRASELKKPSD